jgi:UDP-N-acetylenolpyruvoylglucosamine reductase
MKKNKIRKYFFIGEGSNIIFRESLFSGIIIKISNDFLE